MNLEWFKSPPEGFAGTLAWDEPLARHSYYRIGGPARLLVAPKGLMELQWVAEGLKASDAPYFVLGLGSNLLVSDKGFNGVVIKTGRMNLDISLPAEGVLRTGASVAVSSLLRRAAQEGWDGLEFMTGIPGAIGGVVVMNGGTHLGEAKDRIRKVEALSLADPTAGLRTYEGDVLRFEYRKNLFLPEDSVVWAAEWSVDSAEPARVKHKIDETLARRKASQPIDYPSCGSVFKNPRAHGMNAWQVIDRLGLRGHRIGNAQFAEKHPNFIINLGGATAADVTALISLAKGRALAELGVPLEEEVRYLG